MTLETKEINRLLEIYTSSMGIPELACEQYLEKHKKSISRCTFLKYWREYDLPNLRFSDYLQAKIKRLYKEIGDDPEDIRVAAVRELREIFPRYSVNFNTIIDNMQKLKLKPKRQKQGGKRNIIWRKKKVLEYAPERKFSKDERYRFAFSDVPEVIG